MSAHVHSYMSNTGRVSGWNIRIHWHGGF